MGKTERSKWAGAHESISIDCIGRMLRQASDGTRRILFAIGDELSAIHCGDVSQSSAEILLRGNYED